MNSHLFSSMKSGHLLKKQLKVCMEVVWFVGYDRIKTCCLALVRELDRDQIKWDKNAFFSPTKNKLNKNQGDVDKICKLLNYPCQIKTFYYSLTRLPHSRQATNTKS